MRTVFGFPIFTVSYVVGAFVCSWLVGYRYGYLKMEKWFDGDT